MAYISEVNEDTCAYFWWRFLLSRFDLCDGGPYSTPDRCNPTSESDPYFCPQCPFGQPNVSEAKDGL